MSNFLIGLKIFIRLAVFLLLSTLVHSGLWAGNTEFRVTDAKFLVDTTDTVFPKPVIPTGASPSDYMFDPADEPSILLQQPENITTEIVYDPETNRYYKITKVGDLIIGRPQIISFEEYLEYDMDKALQDYWVEKSKPQEFQRQDGIIPQIYVGGEVFERIFGGSTIDIRPTGSAELIFGVLSNRR
ncbi:MAG: hypothetical protein ACOC2E_04700, partial [Bacteroidota bacterium]